MEKTTRPTQIKTRTPLNQRTGQKTAQNNIYSQGAGEAGQALQGGGQQGQWASHLSNGYEHRLTGQEPEGGQDVQEPGSRQNERMIQGRRGRRPEQGTQDAAGQQNMSDLSGESDAREAAGRQRDHGVNGAGGRTGNQQTRSRIGSRMYQEAMRGSGVGDRAGQEQNNSGRGVIGGAGSRTGSRLGSRETIGGGAGNQPGRETVVRTRESIGGADRQPDRRADISSREIRDTATGPERRPGLGSREQQADGLTQNRRGRDFQGGREQPVSQRDAGQRYGRDFQRSRSQGTNREEWRDKSRRTSQEIQEDRESETRKENQSGKDPESRKSKNWNTEEENLKGRERKAGQENQKNKAKQSGKAGLKEPGRQKKQAVRTGQGKAGVRTAKNSGQGSRSQQPGRKTIQTGEMVQGKTPPRPKRKPGGANFLVQGSILAVAGIIVRLIGMVYRIPLARKIGDNGNGYYNAAYSIYSILLIMSSYSLPTAVSKMISARLAKGEYRTSTRIFRAAMFYATVAGMVGFCALWFGADYFASQIIKMPYSSYALKALAPTIWIMAYLGVLRGYFQGHSTMIPTAVSQVFEQVVNAVISIMAASILFDIGVKSNLVYGDTEYSYAFGAAGGAIGTGAGAVTALVFFMLLALAYRPTMRKKARRDRGMKVESYGAISQALFATIVPIIVSSAIYNVSNVVDNSLFGHVMEGLGESSLTASHWGVYMGRYHLLFNIPVAIANSLSSSLIPSLSRAVAEKNRRQIHGKIASAIRFSMIIAIPSAVGLTVLAGPVSDLLFSGMDNTMLIEMMTLGSSAVVFFSLSTVSNAILQGINRMNMPIINSAVSLAIHVGVLYVMLKFFHMGIYSVVYANILFAVLVCLLNAVSIARYAKYRQELVKTFLIPLLASAAMGGAAWGIYQLCSKAAGNYVSTAAAILVAVAVYFVLLILFKGIDEQELRMMPGGTRLLRVARRLHLM